MSRKVGLRFMASVGGKGVATLPNILDLSFPSTSTDSNVTYWSGIGRKVFYANGLFWVFYSDGTNMIYQTSEDGVTWSAATTIRTCDTGQNFSVWFDGTYLHYAATAVQTYNGPIVYRRGIPNSDGTITWSAAEQTARQDANIAFKRIIIAVDSAGFPWIGMYSLQKAPLTAGSFADVTKSSTNDGTWVTDSGFPYQPDTTKNKRDIMILIPLTLQKMYIIYVWTGGPASNPINGRLWSGGAWSDQETPTTRQSWYASISAVGYRDIVHIVFDEYTTGNAYHLQRTEDGWSETSLGISGYGAAGFSLTVQKETGYLWLFYIVSNEILYGKYVTSWLLAVVLQSRTATESPFSVNSYYQVYGDKLGVVWTESPAYTIAHSGLYG